MKLKYMMIASLVLNIAIFALVFMQKGAYVSQAKAQYEKVTGKYYDQAAMIVGGQNEVIANNALLWNLACTANMTAKNSKDFATTEKRIDTDRKFLSPEVRTDPATKIQTRKVSWNADYYIVAYFDKTQKFLGVNVDALLGKAPPAVALDADDSSEDGDTSAAE